jgi:hypothetical protein
MPDRYSVYGFLTRILPFWTHVIFKKYVTRDPHAGEPGHDPFPTFYDPVVSRRGIRDYCASNDLNVLVEFASNHYLPELGRWASPVFGLTKIVEYLSLRRLSADYNNLAYVIEKPIPAR